MSSMKIAVLTCLVLVIAVGFASAKPSNDYCNISKDHTMCRYRGVNQFKCRYMRVHGVSEQDKEQILLSHNTARNNIALGKERRGIGGPQPPAANMKKLVWNDELATIAQRWSDQCVPYNTDTCRDTPKMTVGQNIFTNFWMEEVRNTTRDWEWAVRGGWANLAEKFNSSLVAQDYARTFYPPYYTQLAWAETETIGCGHVFYKIIPNDYWIYDGYVCNYGPAGNVEGQKMYIIGDAATKCPKGYKRDATYEGLCSKKKVTLPVEV